MGGGAAAGTIVASADPSLPDRSAAQLLVDVQNAKVDGLSGTIVQTADLGLPDISGLTDDQSGAQLTRLITGSNTAQVWYAGDTKVRLALMSTLGETDVIRNGTDVWLWNSTAKTAKHLKVPGDQAERPKAALGNGVLSTPQEAAAAALAAIDPTTKVSTTGAAKVAGRDAYELVLSPKDAASLIGQVRLAIDAKTHIPLRVDVYAKNATNPAVRVAFQQISFTTPADDQFTFNAPPGTKVTDSTADKIRKDKAQQLQERKKAVTKADRTAASGEPTVIGKGWTSIVEAKMPSTKGSANSQVTAALNMLPKASGSWGSGHVFAGSLFSVLITDDGRVFAGAVAPETLYQAAAK
jgi:outer membrane lipoprotein-sorting protein